MAESVSRILDDGEVMVFVVQVADYGTDYIASLIKNRVAGLIYVDVLP